MHPADLGAGVITQLLEHNQLGPTKIDDVIFGCVDAIGPQAGNIARTAWLAAGFPEQVASTELLCCWAHGVRPR